MGQPPVKERSWTEDREVAGNELVGRVRDLVQEGNVRRLIIRDPEGGRLLEIPLTAGALAGGAAVILAPWLSLLVFIGGALARVRIEIVRTTDGQR